MVHLQTVSLKNIDNEVANIFPFAVPTISSFAGSSLTFTADVTFFIGENGSGKSTLLEAIACAARAITVGSDSLDRDATLESIRALGDMLKLSWNRRTHRGFFLRAEDFFGYAKRMRALLEESEAALRAIDADTSLSETARGLARMPHARSVAEMRKSYGDGLDTFSHGESFFTLFKSRLVPDGLYLLDEPETPLSPMRQLGLLSMIKMMVEEQRAQFIVATHSPILMAYPGAAIYTFDGGQIQQIVYDQVEHVTLTRDFLNNPIRFLRHL